MAAPVTLAVALSATFVAVGQAQTVLPPPPGSEPAAPSTAPSVTAPPLAAPPVATGLPTEELASFQARAAALIEREQAALARVAPASTEQLDRLATAQKSGISPEMLAWEEQALAFYLAWMQTADPQVGAAFPARDAVLDVTMVQIDLDSTVSRPGTALARTLKEGEPQLQVARAGSPEIAILWIKELGYVALPPEYVQPYIDRVATSPLQIGGQ